MRYGLALAGHDRLRQERRRIASLLLPPRSVQSCRGVPAAVTCAAGSYALSPSWSRCRLRAAAELSDDEAAVALQLLRRLALSLAAEWQEKSRSAAAEVAAEPPPTSDGTTSGEESDTESLTGVPTVLLVRRLASLSPEVGKAGDACASLLGCVTVRLTCHCSLVGI